MDQKRPPDNWHMYLDNVYDRLDLINYWEKITLKSRYLNNNSRQIKHLSVKIKNLKHRIRVRVRIRIRIKT